MHTGLGFGFLLVSFYHKKKIVKKKCMANAGKMCKQAWVWDLTWYHFTGKIEIARLMLKKCALRFGFGF